MTVLTLCIPAPDARAQDGDELLRGFSSSEQQWMRRACEGYGLSGPASLYRCFRRQADDLKTVPGPPSLAEFSTTEQASMRQACVGYGVSGPASLYRCLHRQADDLRKAKRDLGLTAVPPQNPPARLDKQAASRVPIATTRVPRAKKPGPAHVVPKDTPPTIAQPARPRVLPSQQPAASQAPQKNGDLGWPLLFWALVIGVWVGRRRIFARIGRHTRRPSTPPQDGQPPPHDRPRHNRQVNPRIVFADQRPDGASTEVVPASLADLRDAVTGRVLNAILGLSRCTQCRVFYQRASLDFLRQENGGRCVACGSLAILSIDHAGGHHQAGRNHEPGVTTLADYRSKVGQIVIFEGRCVAVRTSAGGTAYAAMFETGGWTRGFKLVFRTASVKQVGGLEFIWGLAGKHIRVRGLIVHHPQYGYEIVVNDRSMILGVRS